MLTLKRKKYDSNLVLNNYKKSNRYPFLKN